MVLDQILNQWDKKLKNVSKYIQNIQIHKLTHILLLSAWNITQASINYSPHIVLVPSLFFKDLFIYYVHSVLLVCIPAGQKRGPDLITDGSEPPVVVGSWTQDLWKNS